MISIIILNWNGKKWLKKCIDSLNAQTNQDFEIILTDNNSDDGSREFVKKNYPNVQIMKQDDNLGYTGANNKAAKIAKGRYLIFLNNDTWLEKDFMEQLQKFMKDNDYPKLIQPAIMLYEELDHAKKLHLTGMDRFSYPTVSKTLFYVDGCCFTIDKEHFEMLGGFDDRYFIFMEDVGLSWESHVVGQPPVYCKNAYVHHECGGTVVGSMTKGTARHKTSTFRRYLSEKNSLANVLKVYEAQNLIWAVPLHISFGLGEVLLYLLTGNFKPAKTILRSIGWNFQNIGSTLEKRRRLNKLRKVKDSEIMKKMTPGVGKWIAFRDIGGVPDFGK